MMENIRFNSSFSAEYMVLQEMSVIGLFFQHFKQEIGIVSFSDIHNKIQTGNGPIGKTHINLMIVRGIEAGYVSCDNNVESF